jgi:PGF-CTERM protein
VNYASFGEAGAFVMLWYPSYQTRENQVVPLDIFGPEPPDLYDYDHRYTAGWDGDRLVPYVTDDSATTNETGYVWKLVWDSPAEAREFATGYRQLLRYHGAERVGADTYVVPEGRSEKSGGEFGDAFHLLVERDTVTIVNAPTTEDLDSIHDGVEREPVPTTRTTTSGDATTADPTGVSEPGFGVLAAILAVLAGALLARSRS